MQGYRIVLKVGHVDTDLDGRIVHDASAHRDYKCEPHDDWRVLGIARRHNLYRWSTLAECAADPSLIGQGWVHDIDHGSHRLWGMPKSNRAVRVELL